MPTYRLFVALFFIGLMSILVNADIPTIGGGTTPTLIANAMATNSVGINFSHDLITTDFNVSGAVFDKAKLLNRYDSVSNQLLDCGITTCKMQFNELPTSDIVIAPGVFSGSSDPNCSYVGTTYYNGSDWQNLSDGMVLHAGGNYTIGQDFVKSNPTSTCDVIPNQFNTSLSQLAWWNISWSYSVPITVNTTVASNLVMFPAMISMNTSNSTLWNTTTCGNVRFLDSANNSVLLYDLDNNASTFCGNATNNATFYVVGNFTGGVNNTIYAYLGNLAASNGKNPIAAWGNASYNGVFHLSESSTPFIDSAGNNNLTWDASGLNQSNTTKCKIGTCAVFNNIDNSCSVAGSTSANKPSPVNLPYGNSQDYTQSIWSYSGKVSSAYQFSLAGFGSYYTSELSRVLSKNTAQGYMHTSGNSSYAFSSTSSAGTNNVWQYVSGKSNMSATNNTIYLNGMNNGSQTTNVSGASNSWLELGATDGAGADRICGANATLDEWRISNVSRSNDWITAEYAQFSSIGATQNATYSVSLNSPNPEYDVTAYNHTMTIDGFSPISTITASFTMNDVSWSAVLTANNSTEFNFTAANVYPSSVSSTQTQDANWSFLITYQNSTQITGNASTAITVIPGGLFLCNASITQPSINYSFYDAATLAPLNATLSATYSYLNKSSSFTQTNNTSIACILPSTASVQATALETINATGYYGITNVAPLQTYNNTSIARSFGLVNVSSGAFYTFQVQNAFAVPIQNASIAGYHYISSNNSWVNFQNVLSDSFGQAIFFLIPGNLYNFSVQATGYNNLTFSFTPSSQTTIIVQLTATSSNVSPTNPMWFNVYYSINPASGYYNTTQTLSFAVVSNTSNLTSYGMSITRFNSTNTTTVYNQTRTNPSGANLSYVASPSATYVMYAWYLLNGSQNFSIPPVSYYITNQSVGMAQVRNMLGTGTVVSGWTYYFFALAIAIIVGIGINHFVGAGAGVSALGALAVLTFFTILAPPNMWVISTLGANCNTLDPFGNLQLGCISPWLITLTIGIGTIAAFYVTQFGV
jgi:hypothetical protein